MAQPQPTTPWGTAWDDDGRGGGGAGCWRGDEGGSGPRCGFCGFLQRCCNLGGWRSRGRRGGYGDAVAAVAPHLETRLTDSITSIIPDKEEDGFQEPLERGPPSDMSEPLPSGRVSGVVAHCRSICRRYAPSARGQEEIDCSIYLLHVVVVHTRPHPQADFYTTLCYSNLFVDLRLCQHPRHLLCSH